MSEIIFVRHGQASFGKASYDKLSELGLEQVQHLARYWSDLGETFDQIYVGSLRRQKEPAMEFWSKKAKNPKQPITSLGQIFLQLVKSPTVSGSLN